MMNFTRQLSTTTWNLEGESSGYLFSLRLPGQRCDSLTAKLLRNEDRRMNISSVDDQGNR